MVFLGVDLKAKKANFLSWKIRFFDKDIIPIYNDDNPKEYKFKGNRIKRGLYQTGTNYLTQI